eukprot:463483_1
MQIMNDIDHIRERNSAQNSWLYSRLFIVNEFDDYCNGDDARKVDKSKELDLRKPQMPDRQGRQSSPPTSALPIGIIKNTSTDIILQNGLKDSTKSVNLISKAHYNKDGDDPKSDPMSNDDKLLGIRWYPLADDGDCMNKEGNIHDKHLITGICVPDIVKHDENLSTIGGYLAYDNVSRDIQFDESDAYAQGTRRGELVEVSLMICPFVCILSVFGVFTMIRIGLSILFESWKGVCLTHPLR